MGYYTRYKLDIFRDHKYISAQCEPGLLEAIRADDACCYGSLDWAYFDQGEEVKWYEHEEDMKKFSKRFPDIVFCLEGRDEEGEVWRKYFKDGKFQYVKPQITWPDYNVRDIK